MSFLSRLLQLVHLLTERTHWLGVWEDCVHVGTKHLQGLDWVVYREQPLGRLRAPCARVGLDVKLLVQVLWSHEEVSDEGRGKPIHDLLSLQLGLGAQDQDVRAPVVDGAPDRDGLVQQRVHQGVPAVVDWTLGDPGHAGARPQALHEVVLVAEVLQEDRVAAVVDAACGHFQWGARVEHLVPLEGQDPLHDVVEQVGDVQDGLLPLPPPEPREADEVLVRNVLVIDVSPSEILGEKVSQVDGPGAASVNSIKYGVHALLVHLHEHACARDPPHPAALHHQPELEPVLLHVLAESPVEPPLDDVKHRVQVVVSRQLLEHTRPPGLLVSRHILIEERRIRDVRALVVRWRSKRTRSSSDRVASQELGSLRFLQMFPRGVGFHDEPVPQPEG
mmetsp:Transcript_9018/g.24277  ORF Transcript_9018/g.24277 Transcript_9018/m.24277 type:complete len:390 (-) Transcript_9018:433-1602(-)